MTTCPSCGERAFSAWKKVSLPLGRLRPCDHCGATLGISSSAVLPNLLFVGAVILAYRTESIWLGLAYILFGLVLCEAITLAWIPLWQVISVQTRDAERPQRARADVER